VYFKFACPNRKKSIRGANQTNLKLMKNGIADLVVESFIEKLVQGMDG